MSLASGVPFGQLDPKISANTLQKLSDSGFSRCTPVQQATIPLLLSHKDVAVHAATGSGKTLAFAVPLLEISNKLSSIKKHSLLSLIIAPTRELATQIHQVIHKLTEGGELRLLLTVGGNNAAEDCATIENKGCNVLIGTPGRIQSVFDHTKTIIYRNFEILILDEADRLLEMGFRSNIDSILAKLPKQRRTGLFSATLTAEVEDLARAGLRNPRRVTVRSSSQRSDQITPSTLDCTYAIVPVEDKLRVLVKFIQDHREQRIIVFMLTCAMVDYVSKILPSLPGMQKVNTFSLHGKMIQKKRSNTFSSFANSQSGVLMCTDIAARGLDIQGIDCIVQVDAPQDPASFVHRVGRAGRMGAKGYSMVMLDAEELDYVEFQKLAKVPLREDIRYSNPAAKSANVKQSENDHEQKQLEDKSVSKKKSNIDNALPSILDASRELSRKDRDIFERSQKAMVSWIRAYKEHKCSYIFRLSKLSIPSIAKGFGLLKLPKMPELKMVKVDTKDWPRIDVNKIAYRDKKREAARQLRLQTEREMKETSKAPLHKCFEDQDSNIGQKRKAIERNSVLQQSNPMDDSNEEDDFTAEAKALKKMKSGKMAANDFDDEFGSENSDSDSGRENDQQLKRSSNGLAPVLEGTLSHKSQSSKKGMISSSGVAWSNKVEAKNRRQMRRGKKAAKKAWLQRTGQYKSNAIPKPSGRLAMPTSRKN